MENKTKLKRYFYYNGLHMLHLFGKVWLQYDNNVTDNKGFFRRGKGYKWYEGWFRFVIGKYGLGLFFIDKGVLNYTWDRVIKKWEGNDNG